jgi:hypothetical protein
MMKSTVVNSFSPSISRHSSLFRMQRLFSKIESMGRLRNSSLSTSTRKREEFHPDEDAGLKRLIVARGTEAWDVIATGLLGRPVHQCRNRPAGGAEAVA